MRRWIVACVWLICALAHVQSLRAQVPESPLLRVIGPRDGLPTTAVNSLARDRAGFVWVATNDGLARYDGSGFRTWRHEIDDPRSMNGNVVQIVHVDRQDRVWTSSEFGGLSMLDKHRNRFRHWTRETHPQLGSNDVFAIESSDDTLWFGTGDAGLYRMSLVGDSSQWKPVRIDGLPSETVINVDLDDRGRLWIATYAGLALLENGRLTNVPMPDEDAMPVVYSVMADRGRIWVGTSVGIFRRSVQGRWTRLPYADMFQRPNAAIAFARGRDGVLWIGSQRQLWRVRGDDAIPEPVQTEPSYRIGPVHEILLQPDGGIWATLPGLGLGYLRSDWRSLAQLRKRGDGDGDGDVGGLQGSTYRVAAPARRGGVWVAAVEGNIERVDGVGVAERISTDIRAYLPTSKPGSMVEDHLGQLWVFYGGAGLWRIGADGRVDQWPVGEGPDATQDGPYHFQTIAPDGTWWAGISGIGLEQRDIVTGKVLRRINLHDAGAPDAEIESMQWAPDGRMWLSGTYGVGWMDLARGKLVVPSGLAGTRVFAFDFADRDHLWLYRVDELALHTREKGRWPQLSRLPTGKQLPAVQVAGMKVDARGRVWLPSQRGLFRWDPRRRHVDRIGIQNGLTTQEFAERSTSLTAAGMFAVVARDGSVVFVDTHYPDSQPTVPSLLIDAVDVRRDGGWVSQPVTDALSFDPEDREFRITGHLLAFDDPTGTRYWSQLQGFDKTWVDQGAQGERIFSGLGPGTYRLRMRATDAAGNPAREQTLAFTVRPPWWRTMPALLIASVVIVGILALLAFDYRRRLRRNHALALAEQQREMAVQASQAKTRFLATLGHEIRTPMTGVLGMAELLQGSKLDDRQQGQVHAIYRAGNHLLRLLNDALDLARIEADKLLLTDEPFDMHVLVDSVVELMAPLAERKQLQFQLHRAADLPRVFIGDRTRIEQILLNLLGNAIKFTERGEVGLTVLPLRDGGVRFVVHDSGPGLNEEQRGRLFRRFEQAEGARTNARYGGSGLGLAISQELSAAMGGRIDLESALGMGARFTVDLPLKVDASVLPTSVKPAAREASSMQLLLVEDDDTVAEVVADLLRTQGHCVRHAPHALAALTEVASAEFDAGLLDLDLPGMDGFELAKQLRHAGFSGALLAVTARADAEAESLSRAAGFNAFLRKPVTADMLAQALHQAITARAKQRAE